MAKSLSIVIPAYNEESALGACLDSIACQTVLPDEVIVVDNNSTDRTAAIAASYPFVTLIHEVAQGRAHARNAGFSAAHGDIIGRINADVLLCQDWVRHARQAFDSNQALGGLTGPLVTDTIPGTAALSSTFWPRLYFRLVKTVLRTQTMLGGNMLISQQAWATVKHETCLDDLLVHEDQDISLLLAGYGYEVRQDNRLTAALSGQHFHSWEKLTEYTNRMYATRNRHRRLGTLKKPGARVTRPWVGFGVAMVGALPLLVFAFSSLVRSRMSKRLG